MITSNQNNTTLEISRLQIHAPSTVTEKGTITTQHSMPNAAVSPLLAKGDPSGTTTNSITEKPFIDIEEKYLIDPRVVGYGRQGSVRHCIDRKTGRRLAVKSIQKSDPRMNSMCLRREVTLLGEATHSNIIQFVDACEDEEYLHIVTDLCEGGDLFDRASEKLCRGDGFTEQQTARILHQILNALRYLHQRNIVHRDLKPENLLFETDDDDSTIKLIDFGLARKHHSNKGEPPITTVVGTPYYIAPEVLRQNYGKSCDVWAVGVIAYILLCGQPPFNGPNNKAICRSVIRDPVHFQSRAWRGVSTSAKHFIMRLLQKDPRNRMTVEQALRHPWIVGQVKRRDHGSDAGSEK